MTDIMFRIMEVITTLIEAYIGFLFSCGFLTEGKRRDRELLGGALIWTLAILLVNQYRLFSAFTSVVAITVWVVLSILICRTDFLWTVLSYALYVILIHIIDFLSISVWSLVFGNSRYGVLIISEYSAYRLVHIVFCKVLLIVIWIFFLRKMAGRITVPVKRIVMAAAVGSVLIWYLGAITFTTSEVSLAITWGILLFVLLTGICLMREYSRWKDAQSQYRLAVQRNEWMAKNYQSNQIFYHDLNNHYLVLKGLLREKEYGQAEKYMEKLGEPLNFERISWTGNQGLDILLNHKLTVAREKLIEMEIIPDKITLKLTDEELTVLFGNALDNAIEACEKLKEEQRWIRFQMKQVGEMTFFVISNPITAQSGAGETVLTSKKDKTRHGLGMTSMEIIARKYGGIVEVNVEEEKFVLSISFFGDFEDKKGGYGGRKGYI